VGPRASLDAVKKRQSSPGRRASSPSQYRFSYPGPQLLRIINLYYLLAEIPGVARDSIGNEGTREINYGSCISASRPERKTPGTHWIGGWVGPRTGMDVVEEKHLAPAGNPTPTVQPLARRDATDTGVRRMAFTPLHIYFSLEFCL
jgi:hypothetical protein